VGNPAAVTLLTTDRVVAIANVSQHPELGTWRDDLRALGVQSCLAVRTAERERPTGLVVLHQVGYPRPWTAAEIALLQDVASHLGIAFAQADLLLREQRQNRALSQLKQQAEAASRAKGEFLAMMSHELRTPLNAVLGFTELMMLDTLAPKHREMLTLVHQSGQNLLRVLNDILAFTRAEAEHGEPTLEVFSPAVWVNEAIARWQRPAQERGSTVTVAVGATVPPWVRGDRGRLEQILEKLLDNAVKFGNGRAIEIAVTWVEPNHLEITVRDWGIGIAPADFNKLFEPFVQADLSATRRYGGTGLGLAIADRLCRQLSGQLWVISGGQVGGHPPPDLRTEDVWAVATGSQFGLRVAVLPAETESHPSVASSSLQVLVVEDNPVNQRVMRRMLERLGHSTAVVTNGREALTWLQDHHCDLVLMDIHMPEMDGLEATRQIRRSQAQRQLCASLPSPLPIVAVTANDLAESRTDCLAAGMTDYLGKPLTVGMLMACLEKHTGN
jgi:signal transduction histidine kinase/ActR/RegA family two-component response regulator